MRTFYFVGGPIDGQGEAFRRRLAQVGGSPPGWQIYPHASGDGRALHVVSTEAEEAIEAHLANFDPIYMHGPIVEVIAGLAGKADRSHSEQRP
jgi:hypothetical protein